MTITQTPPHSFATASDSSRFAAAASDSSYYSATTSDSSHYPAITTTDDSSHPIISVESADVAECHLLSYLGSPDTLDDLRLRIPESLLFSRSVKEILKSALRQKRRFSYDRETSLLRIHAMARPVHDAVSLFLADFKLKGVTTGFITPEEQEYISCGNAGVRLAKIRFDTNQKMKKRQAWTKFPDAVITFGPKGSIKVPRVVFEVGFSEEYIDLVSDAKQWLKRSGGKTRLVVLVNIEEDKKSRKARLSSNEAKTRIRDLVARFGNAEGKRREGIDDEGFDVESDVELDVEPDVEPNVEPDVESDMEPDVESDTEPDTDFDAGFDEESDADSDAGSDAGSGADSDISTPALYDEIMAAIITEDWVGPISATLEVWHNAGGVPKRRQRIVRPHYSYV